MAAGAHRVPVDSPKLDPGTATPFQSLAGAEDQRAVAPLRRADEPGAGAKAPAGCGQRHGTATPLVDPLTVAGVVAMITASHDAQRRGHGELSWGQDRARQQELAFRQAGLVTSVAKGRRRTAMAAVRVSMAGPFRRKWSQADLPCLFSFSKLC